MPLCGFNKKMIEGIRTFSEGLVQATIDRGEQNGLTCDEAFAIELRDIELFMAALSESHQAPDRCDRLKNQMVYGIAVFAHGLFRSGLARAKSNDDGPQRAFEIETAEATDFLQHLEDEHQLLKGCCSPEETARRAVAWMIAHDKALEPSIA